MKTIFMAAVPPVPHKDSYDFASMRDYGMQVAAHVRQQYQERIAALDARVAANWETLTALEEIVELCQQHGAKFSLQNARAAIAKATGAA